VGDDVVGLFADVGDPVGDESAAFAVLSGHLGFLLCVDLVVRR
jgi:hypothetical protein